MATGSMPKRCCASPNRAATWCASRCGMIWKRARGHADLAVDGLVFDDAKQQPGVAGGLQPKMLTPSSRAW